MSNAVPSAGGAINSVKRNVKIVTISLDQLVSDLAKQGSWSGTDENVKALCGRLLSDCRICSYGWYGTLPPCHTGCGPGPTTVISDLAGTNIGLWLLLHKVR